MAAGGGLTQQARILLSQLDGGARLLRWVQHHLAVGGVKRRLEERAVHGAEKRFRIDALRRCIDKGFAERLDHGADEKVPTQLDGMSLARLRAHNRDATGKRFKQRASLG